MNTLSLPTRAPSSMALGQFDPEDLAAKQAELQQLRAERRALEAELEQIRRGPSSGERSSRARREGEGRARLGGLPVPLIVGAGVVGLFVLSRFAK